ncbi:hypothetical protein SAMN05443574_1417 [Haloarcula vallismortis]|uniref:DUF7979 domain-containing protein n=2 Tax=Haloarcula vallismortis TaxID=28442 RepID=M0JKH4_HALVA|nr:hypothetical protein [Haloarcula vallismortis]EMA08848.1 hypothetical protein C437_07557 [Haloarcula vallismortis ATCC 29715]SDX38645.1 hypothetical protein SAMN05443574_1417 [Haloarcula vallismortis]
MSRPDNRKPAGGALIIAGFTIIVIGFILVPHPGEAAAIHEIERTVDADEVPQTKNVVPVSDLSPAAKSAFQETQASNGEHVIYGKESHPSEWRYSDDVGYYYIQSDGRIYEMTTRGASPQILDYIKISLFLFTGISLSGVGVRWLQQN